MIKPDVNLLVYAYDDTSSFYQTASAWLENVLSNEQVLFSWHTICGFLRIVTNRRIYLNPMGIDQAVEVVSSWLALENTHLVALEKKNWPLLAEMLIEGKADGNLVMDVHLAAVAASFGATLASTDRDFARFPNLRLIDPLKK